MPPKLYDETSAGAYLGGNKPISPRTMQRWRATGEGPEFIRLQSGHWPMTAYDPKRTFGTR
jgi:hypothetical protein